MFYYQNTEYRVQKITRCRRYTKPEITAKEQTVGQTRLRENKIFKRRKEKINHKKHYKKEGRGFVS